MTTMYFARVPFDYMGQSLERGELLALRGSPNDGKLVGLRYFVVFNKDEHRELSCQDCGKRFVGDSFLHMHRKKGCLAESPEITRAETADLLGVDPKSVKVED